MQSEAVNVDSLSNPQSMSYFVKLAGNVDHSVTGG
jgi:hypothetical protein